MAQAVTQQQHIVLSCTTASWPTIYIAGWTSKTSKGQVGRGYGEGKGVGQQEGKGVGQHKGKGEGEGEKEREGGKWEGGGGGTDKQTERGKDGITAGKAGEMVTKQLCQIA